MRILFDPNEVYEWCAGCKRYEIHFLGKTDEGYQVFKCKLCTRLTVWLGGDTEKVLNVGQPPAGV